MCGSRKYPYPPHGGSRKFRGVGGSKNDKFPKGRGVTQTGFFYRGFEIVLKICKTNNTYVLSRLPNQLKLWLVEMIKDWFLYIFRYLFPLWMENSALPSSMLDFRRSKNNQNGRPRRTKSSPVPWHRMWSDVKNTSRGSLFIPTKFTWVTFVLWANVSF